MCRQLVLFLCCLGRYPVSWDADAMKQGPDPGQGKIPLPACKQPKGGLPDGVHIMRVVPCGAEPRTHRIAKKVGSLVFCVLIKVTSGPGKTIMQGYADIVPAGLCSQRFSPKY